MNASFDTLALEKNCKQKFGVSLEVRQIITGPIPVSRTDTAIVFLTTKKQLYVYIAAQSKSMLADIRKYVSRMGLVAELYVPPKGQPHYFDTVGREKFREVFPGRGHVSDEDIRYYRSLAPYNPALIQISEVKNGEIRQFDSDAAGQWRTATKFAYRRIRTS